MYNASGSASSRCRLNGRTLCLLQTEWSVSNGLPLTGGEVELPLAQFKLEIDLRLCYDWKWVAQWAGEARLRLIDLFLSIVGCIVYFVVSVQGVFAR